MLLYSHVHIAVSPWRLLLDHDLASTQSASVVGHGEFDDDDDFMVRTLHAVHSWVVMKITALHHDEVFLPS